MKFLSKIKNSESKWGKVKTKNGFNFIITYDCVENIYNLYRVVNKNYGKICSSKNPHKLMMKIDLYEDNTKNICNYFTCNYATKHGCSIFGWNTSETEKVKKKFCPIYDVECVWARCNFCSRNTSTSDEKCIYKNNKDTK